MIKNSFPEMTMPRPLNQTETDLNADNLLRLPAEFGCPVWVYDAQIVREKIAALHQFDVVRFAQKACSNIHILRLMREQGVKVDSVSLGEIERALAAGLDLVCRYACGAGGFTTLQPQAGGHSHAYRFRRGLWPS